MRIGSLFSGTGALDMAAAAVFGGETAWVSDIDPGACKILAHRYPGVPNLGDITRVDWSAVEPVDIIMGGSPCQDVSAAGRRAGMVEGTRSNLWVAMRDAISVLRPSYVIWENVRGALSARATSGVESEPGLLGDGSARPFLRALGRVLGDLAGLGYDAGWCGLRAADVGAAHGRFRVFVLAWPAADTACDARWIGERDGCTIADTASVGLDGAERARQRRAGSPNGDCEPVVLLPTPMTENNENRRSAGYGPNLGAAVALLPTPTTEPDTGNGHARNLGHETKAEQWADYAPAIARWEQALGRPAPSPTEPGRNGKPRLAAPFVEWLMGLPAGWVTDVPDLTRTQQLKALGNGVVPQQGAAALRWLLEQQPEAVAA